MEKRCALCGADGWDDPLEKHHIFDGIANRKKSEELGLYVYLCGNRCHREGPRAVHKNARTALALKRAGQRYAMAKFGWDTDAFIREIGRNYL